MKRTKLLLLCLSLVAGSTVACSTSPGRPSTAGQAGASGGPGAAGSSSAGAAGAAGASASGDAGQSGAAGLSGGTAGQSGGGGSAPGGASGADAGAAGSGSAGSTASGAGGNDGGAAGSGAAGAVEVPDGGSFVPAAYTGKPFKTLTIPGIIYAADYDKGFSGVGFCRVGAANPPTPATCGTPKFNDWCCGNGKGCDQRGQAACPVYRQDSNDPTMNDNAGLSHMNGGEPDNWAATGPTWVVGADGNPTLTGPTATVKTPLPYHANMTTDEDVYISYMFTGQWENYTVQVLAAGTYSIGGLMGTPAGTQIIFDFGTVGGTQVTTGLINVPPSPTPQTEAYHEWFNVSNMGTVTFPAAGTYLMRFTLMTMQLNPLFFTFSKM
jgi:hypothetical protein